MASFRIHEDQENTVAARKETEGFPAASQRRALGDLSQFACNQNRTSKFAGLPPTQPTKQKEENKSVRLINNEKNIVPPVAQFRAFSVYEDKPPECEHKKREPFKPLSETRRGEPDQPRPLQPRAEKLTEPPVPAQPTAAKASEKPEHVTEHVEAESPMSVAQDTSVLSVMSVSRNESQLEDTVEEDGGEERTVARTDREMFFHVEVYRNDIYRYMREIEEKHRPRPHYMNRQPDITHAMRGILVDWLAEVCEEYAQQTETLHLAVSYVDRFLSFMSVVRTKLQLVGTAATFIAAKYEEVFPPDVGEFVYITDDTYEKRDVLRMEHLILKVLSFDLSTPTALAFLSHYCISNELPKKMFQLAAYIAELSLLEAEPYLQYKPSVIAASALATARHCLLCSHCPPTVSPGGPTPGCLDTAWPAPLALSSGYEVRELETCMRHLARTHAHAPLQPHRAIPDKYQTNKYDGVSKIAARPMFLVAPYAPAIPRPSPSAVAAPASVAPAAPPAAAALRTES